MKYQQAITITGVALAGVAVGAVGGYLFGKRKFEAFANAEIEDVKERYRRLATPKPSMDELRERLVNQGIVPGPTKEESGYIPGEYKSVATEGSEVVDPRPYNPAQEEIDEALESGEVTINILDRESDDALFERNPDKPYLVSIGDYHDSASDNHEKITLIYYVGDQVLVAEGGQAGDNVGIVDNVDMVVGEKNLLFFGARSEDKDIVYVRNEAFKADYEIVRNAGHYHDAPDVE